MTSEAALVAVGAAATARRHDSSVRSAGRSTAAALAASAGLAANPERWRWVPPAITLPEDGRIAAFDHIVDGWFARWARDRGGPDAVFYAASALGDHGLIWLAIAALRAARRRDPGWRRRLLRVAAGLGVESALVNGPVKWVFRRRRPVQDGPRALYLRQPRTSSFPSGHATAAFFAAGLLRDDDPWWPAYYALAVIVAGSRVHVRIHHASDVVGGALLGVLLGELTRHLVPLPDPALAPPRLTLLTNPAPETADGAGGRS